MNVVQSEHNTDTVFSSDWELLRGQVTEMSRMKQIPNENVHDFKQKLIVLTLPLGHTERETYR